MQVQLKPTDIVKGFKLNKEPGYKLEIAGMLLCLIAIIFIIRSEDAKQTELILAPEGHADDYPLDRKVHGSGTLYQVGGIVITLMATVMSSSVSALNRSLKAIPLSVVLFYQAFVGVCISLSLLIVTVVVGGRHLYFLSFTPY